MMYNPMLDYQRNQLLAQQAMMQNQQMMQPSFNPYPQPQQPQFFVKQIGSMDEARAYPVDPNIIYLFPDTGNGNIYFKRLNTDNGKSEIITYKPTKEGEVVEVDFNETILNRLDSIEKSIGGLNESVSRLTTISKYDEKSNGDVATTSSSKDAKTRP